MLFLDLDTTTNIPLLRIEYIVSCTEIQNSDITSEYIKEKQRIFFGNNKIFYLSCIEYVLALAGRHIES